MNKSFYYTRISRVILGIVLSFILVSAGYAQEQEVEEPDPSTTDYDLDGALKRYDPDGIIKRLNEQYNAICEVNEEIENLKTQIIEQSKDVALAHNEYQRRLIAGGAEGKIRRAREDMDLHLKVQNGLIKDYEKAVKKKCGIVAGPSDSKQESAGGTTSHSAAQSKKLLNIRTFGGNTIVVRDGKNLVKDKKVLMSDSKGTLRTTYTNSFGEVVIDEEKPPMPGTIIIRVVETGKEAPINWDGEKVTIPNVGSAGPSNSKSESADGFNSQSKKDSSRLSKGKWKSYVGFHVGSINTNHVTQNVDGSASDAQALGFINVTTETEDTGNYRGLDFGADVRSLVLIRGGDGKFRWIDTAKLDPDNPFDDDLLVDLGFYASRDSADSISGSVSALRPDGNTAKISGTSDIDTTEIGIGAKLHIGNGIFVSAKAGYQRVDFDDKSNLSVYDPLGNLLSQDNNRVKDHTNGAALKLGVGYEFENGVNLGVAYTNSTNDQIDDGVMFSVGYAFLF